MSVVISIIPMKGEQLNKFQYKPDMENSVLYIHCLELCKARLDGVLSKLI